MGLNQEVYTPVPFRLGHVLLKVPRLREAKQHFEELGFTVTWPTQPKRATNVMIHLADGTFIELFCTDMGALGNLAAKVGLAVMRLSRRPSFRRYQHYLQGPQGFSDYVLESADEEEFERNLQCVKGNGLPVHGPQKKWRTSGEGVRHTWRLYYSDESRQGNFLLPLYKSPYQPAEVPAKAMTTHANGAKGIRSLWVSTTEWKRSLHCYQQMYGQTPSVIKGSGKRCCQFQIGGASLYLSEGKRDGITKICLQTETKKSVRLDRRRCYGAEIWLAEKKEEANVFS